MVTRPKQTKLLLQEVLKFYRRLYGGGYELAPNHTNIYKILKLCSPNIFISFRQITLKLSNFTLILRRSFQVSSLFIISKNYLQSNLTDLQVAKLIEVRQSHKS